MVNILKMIIPPFLKKKLKLSLKKNNFKKFKEKATHLNLDRLIEEFQRAGIKKGDTLFIHSSLKGLGYIENGANTIIDALKQVLTPEGTLIFPTFTIKNSMFETLSNTAFVFNPKTSESTVGSITNHFLNSKDVCRSIHPTHSVAAWGKNAVYITSEHYELETNFGHKTPFGKFLELNGKLMGLGINYAHVTFYHTYEDLNLSKFPEVYLTEKFKTQLMDHNEQVHECETLCHNPEFHKTRIEKSSSTKNKLYH